jgi:peptidoglycan hydrolase-like protein with peptidoglycan-binding domain
MSFTPRAVAVAGCTALLIAGTVAATGSAVAAPSAVGQAPTSAVGSLAPSVVTFGQKTIVLARLTTTSGLTTSAVPGATAYLQHLAIGSTVWTHAAGTHLKQTGRGGRVHWGIKPANSGSFRVFFPATSQYAAAYTAPLSVKVRPNIKVERITTAPTRTTTRIRGQVLPRLTGPVYLQKYVNGAWHRAAHQKAHHGRFAFPIAPKHLGNLKYRVVRHRDPAHLAAVSRPLHVTVVQRELTYGDVGPDVLALWKRLHGLHYDVGGRTHIYGWDLVHAVTAFEKVQGIARNGDAGTAVWRRLSNPKRPHLRYPVRQGYAVEVNLAKEILLISRNGKVWRILDTSTGGGYTYIDSAGQPAVATTPTGHFSFLYKQTGWQHSKLGYLYYPSYFTNTGVAIHGEDNGNSGSEVPPYPASHGCVRITNNAVLRYYYKVFTVGTSVWVYR